MDFNVTHSLNTYKSFGSALISEETRRKLISLGIDPATVTSETQAKKLIAKIECTSEAINISPKKISEDRYTYSTTEPKTDSKNDILSSMVYNAEINKIILGL